MEGHPKDRRAPGVYNLALTGDGKLIATNKRDQSVSVYELKSGRELARVPTKRRVIHGGGPMRKFDFASEERLACEKGRFAGYIASGTTSDLQKAGFVLHSIEDVHGRPLGSLALAPFQGGARP